MGITLGHKYRYQVFDGTLLCEKHLHNCIRNKSNILIEILELKEALKPHAELIRQISPDFRPVDNKLYLKYLTWKSKFFYETLINDISESPKYNMLKNNFNDLQEHEINRIQGFKDSNQFICNNQYILLRY